MSPADWTALALSTATVAVLVVPCIALAVSP